MTSPKNLIKKPENWVVDINNNSLHQAAFFVEHQMQAAGAVADKDYTLLDCFKLGALVCIEAQLAELTKKVAYSAVDIVEDCVEESNDIMDAEIKTGAKASFVVGYQ